MSVVNELRGLSAKAQNYRGQSLSARDTERLLVEPFIDALGYDTRALSEVETQPRIQVGLTEVKCDYAIKRDGAPLILIECKRAGVRLDAPGQLSAYFERARTVWLGVHTNGLEHRFYGGSVSEAGIKHMDGEPFLTLDLLNFDEGLTGQVAASFAKDRFDPNTAQGLAQYIRGKRKVENALREELRSPSDGLVRLVMERVGADRSEFDRYKPIVHAVVPQLSSAPAMADPSSATAPGVAAPVAAPEGIPIRWNYGGQTHEATLLRGGRVRIESDGQEFRRPSPACIHLAPEMQSFDGWREWTYYDREAERRLPIDGLRGLRDEEQIQKTGASIGLVRQAWRRVHRS